MSKQNNEEVIGGSTLRGVEIKLIPSNTMPDHLECKMEYMYDELKIQGPDRHYLTIKTTWPGQYRDVLNPLGQKDNKPDVKTDAEFIVTLKGADSITSFFSMMKEFERMVMNNVGSDLVLGRGILQDDSQTNGQDTSVPNEVPAGSVGQQGPSGTPDPQPSAKTEGPKDKK